MDDVLFTESQWREISMLETTNEECSWQLCRGHPSKQVLASHLRNGEFRACWYPLVFDDEGIVGPPDYQFFVYEVKSEFIIGWGLTLSRALRDSREFFETIGPEHLGEMMRRSHADVVRREADQAIATAKKPRKVGKRARAVFEASNGKCHYCETVLTLDGRWHIEHKFPRALFGGSEQDNLVAACAPCNHAKRDKTDLEFIAARKAQA